MSRHFVFQFWSVADSHKSCWGDLEMSGERDCLNQMDFVLPVSGPFAVPVKNEQGSELPHYVCDPVRINVQRDFF